MSSNQIVDQVLGKKSGYIKGLGYRSKLISMLFALMHEENKKLEETLKKC
ncbi:unnamed protein product [Coffea canephora]|uniref:Uncharacterized protein n=1 Tax=Coffea canephora TaxID=49390 RepID=A0A068UG41_COFCA|nr:unnamed protein product [Coffea canephora]